MLVAKVSYVNVSLLIWGSAVERKIDPQLWWKLKTCQLKTVLSLESSMFAPQIIKTPNIPPEIFGRNQIWKSLERSLKSMPLKIDFKYLIGFYAGHHCTAPIPMIVKKVYVSYVYYFRFVSFLPLFSQYRPKVRRLQFFSATFFLHTIYENKMFSFSFGRLVRASSWEAIWCANVTCTLFDVVVDAAVENSKKKVNNWAISLGTLFAWNAIAQF